MNRLALLGIATVLLASHAFAQTAFPELEPNSQKSEATAVVGIVAGDSIVGVTTGTVTTPGDTTLVSADVFRVQTGALPLGIYQHRLVLTTGGPVGHTGTIRGLNQLGTVGVGGIPGTVDATIQTSSTASTPQRFNQWYGFGKQEEIYYRVTGAPTTTFLYAATLSTTSISPTSVGTFSSGPITVTTIGQTTTDTVLHLFDANFDPVWANDDEGPNGPTTQSRISLCMAPGTYYLAVGMFRQIWSVPANADDDFLGNPLMDLPNSLCADAAAPLTLDWDFLITDGTATAQVSNTHPANTYFETSWFTFTVLPPAAPANDACANAMTLATGTVTGNLVAATNDGTASCDPGGSTSKDLWYTFTNAFPYPTLLSIDTCGTAGVDTVLTAFSGCGGTELACSNDCGGSPCGGPTSCLSLSMAPGQTALLRLSDKGTGGSCFQMHVKSVLDYDNCATPVVIAGPGFHYLNNASATTGAEGQANGAICAVQGAAAIPKDVWFTYTSTTNGPVLVSTCGLIPVPPSPNSNSKVAIYAGAGCPSAIAIACNDNAGETGSVGGPCSSQVPNSTVGFTATCGGVYTIQIGMASTAGSSSILGQFSLTESTASCIPPFTSFCSGDGSDTACPCGNTGAAGKGCQNAAGTGGASITCTGLASLAADSLVVHGGTAAPFGPGLYFQGSSTILMSGPPFGIGYGHGVVCMGGAVVRLQIVNPADGTGASATSVVLHNLGGITSAGSYNYQLWYRDGASVGSCSAPASAFNFSNAITVAWIP